jgi:hypothetical protein
MHNRETSNREIGGISELCLPPRECQDIAIIGGGLSSLTFASQLLYSSGQLADDEFHRLSKLSSLPKRGLGPVCVLSAGNSIAYEPANGEFSKFLTLSGSDRLGRRDELISLRNMIKASLQTRGGSYCEGATVRKIIKSEEGGYQIRVAGEYGERCVKARKLAIALGHTLREIPESIRTHVIMGAGELCATLDTYHANQVPYEDCLTHLLRNYKTTSEGSLRIGMVGVGMSFVEVVKIFEALLDKPSHETGKYTIRGSSIPVEFVVYAPRLTYDKVSWQDLCQSVEKGLSELPPVYSGPDRQRAEDESLEYKKAGVSRVGHFGKSGQLRVIPRRFDWALADKRDGMIRTNAELDGPGELSCIIDCAPFINGLSEKQADILRELADIQISKRGELEWWAELAQGARRNIALLGAAFTPSSRWNESQWAEQATEALIEFYSPDPRECDFDERSTADDSSEV